MLRLDMAPNFWLGEHAGLNLDNLDDSSGMGGCRAPHVHRFWIGILRMRLASRKRLQVLSSVLHRDLFSLDTKVVVNNR